MSTELKMEQKRMKAAPLGEGCSVPDLSGEDIWQNQLQFCLDEEEVYGGYGVIKSAYPYRQQNDYTRELQDREVQTIILENRYLKAVFLPEYGGRLWELWDKETGKNLLYTNDVIRFSNLAVRNAWFSGGVEWNAGVMGHSPFTAQQIYAARTKDEKGNPILRMYEYERIRNIVFQMDFWLEEDSRYLNCRMRIANENRDAIPMYWWSVMAVPEYEKGRLIVPSKAAYTSSDGKVYKVEIPVVDGTDVTDYKAISKSSEYFFELEENEPKYIANVDADGYGLIQISTERTKNRKLFSWGNLKGSDHWQEFLTENAGRYVEIQSGFTKTQYGCVPMAPFTVWEWMEQYGAVRISPEELRLSHEERYKSLGSRLRKENIPQRMEEMLKASRAAALQKAEILMPGSGYGILGVHGTLTSHLQFLDKKGDYSKWKAFLEGERLHCPVPEERPDVYLNDEESIVRLKRAVKHEEKQNWYAHYQLGVRSLILGKNKKAKKELKKSLELSENAWAYHGLACIRVNQGKYEKAKHCILKGMELRRADLSYVKEGFKLLLASGGYEELCTFYQAMNHEFQENYRLKFCFIKALSELGRAEKAYELIEENGGLVLDDVREGTDSLAELWSKLHEKIYGVKAVVPYRYQFKTSE